MMFNYNLAKVHKKGYKPPKKMFFFTLKIKNSFLAQK